MDEKHEDYMSNALHLVKTYTGCAPMEVQPRYDVVLHDLVVGQLYFNLRGYVGTLPTPSGANLNIGERSIGAYRKEAKQLNKEFKATTLR